MICDSHFHVFGPAERYPPHAADLRYKPPHAPLESYLLHAKKLGIERYVFVQPSSYGRDNACMLDAMREVGPAKCRGIVDIDENASDAALERLHAAGVRGVRVNVNPIKPSEPGFAASMRSRISRLDARCADHGWMLDFLTPGWLTRELLPTLEKLRSPFSLAHMGMFLAKEALPRDFVEFSRNHSKCWIKLTGVYRLSSAPGFADAAPLAQALIAAAPDRVIWGSDYPHLSFSHVDTDELFGLLKAWAPEEAVRRRILEDNPARCFGF
ncbi:MAG TPA: amidohydrolase family protein [Burkholderiales bacterium]|nr:amidohydrolase family protein [Burkholderiales bacterium]